MLLCFGDSLTAQPHAWPLRMPNAVVVAVQGARAADVPDQLEGQPTCTDAVGTIGTNDVLQLGRPLGIDCLPSLLDAVPSQRVALLDVLLFLPFHPIKYWPELRSRRRAIRVALRATGLPLLRPSLGPLCWQRDGIHPNVRGQRKMAAAVAAWRS